PQGGPVGEADEQRTEMRGQPAGGREAADDELRLVAALHLEPAARAPAGLVCGGVVLGDDALPATSARDPVGGESIARQPACLHQDAAVHRDQGFDRATAFGQRPLQQSGGITLQAVEDGEDGVDGLAERPALQELEARDALAVERTISPSNTKGLSERPVTASAISGNSPVISLRLRE